MEFELHRNKVQASVGTNKFIFILFTLSRVCTSSPTSVVVILRAIYRSEVFFYIYVKTTYKSRSASVPIYKTHAFTFIICFQYQNESSDPVWTGDLCTPFPLADIDLLHPEITLEWTPPADPSHFKGKKLIATAVGRGIHLLICSTSSIY